MKISDLNIVLGNKFHYRDVFIEQDIFPLLSETINQEFFGSDKYGVHQYCNFGNYNIPHQGFKIHISCTIENFYLILNETFSYCYEKDIEFKYIRNTKILSMILSNKVDRELGGKFITIYPENLIHFKQILKELKVILEDFKGTYILTDKRFQDSSVLFYRYGILTPGEYGDYILNLNGEAIKDTRKPYFFLPEFVELPFPEADSKKPKYINTKYKITEALAFKNSGGTYKGNYNDTYIIIKEARKNFGELEENSFQITKKNEATILKKLDSLPWFPKLVDHFFEFENYYVVEEYIAGETFREAKMRLCNIDSSKNNISSYEEIADIFRNILLAVENIHRNNVFIGDISEDNIKIKDSQPFFIDIEQSIIMTEKDVIKDNIIGTMGFYNENIFNLDFFRQDYHQLGYLFMSMFCKANMLLNIDITGVLSMNQFEIIAHHNEIPTVFVNTIRELIYEDDLNISNLISSLKIIEDNQTQKEIIFDYYEVLENLKHSKKLLATSINSTLEEKIKFPTNFPSKSDKGYLYGTLGVNLTLNKDFSWDDNEQKACIENKDYISLLEYIIYTQDNSHMEYLLTSILKELENPYRNIEDEFTLSSGIPGIGCLLNQVQLDKEFTCDALYEDVKKRIQELVVHNCIDNLNNLEIEEVDLSLANGLLGNVYYLISCAANDESKQLISLIRDILDVLINKYTIDIKDVTHFYLYSQNNLSSTYIQNGTSGLILTLLKYSENIDSSYDYLINSIGKTMNIDYTQAGGFLYGLSGIGFVLIKLYEKFNNTHYLVNAIKIFERLDIYLFEYEGTTQTYGPTFSSIGIDFGHGLTGIYHFIDQLQITLVSWDEKQKNTNGGRVLSFTI